MLYTISDIEDLTRQKVTDADVQGRWIVVTLQNGTKVKFKNWKPDEEEKEKS